MRAKICGEKGEIYIILDAPIKIDNPIKIRKPKKSSLWVRVIFMK